MAVGVQQQVLVVTVQKTAKVPHLQFIDKVVAVPADNLLCGGYGGDEGVFAVFCGIFRTPSIWTSSARLAATFLSPRWPTVVGRRGLSCCAAVFPESIWIDTSVSMSCPHHHHHRCATLAMLQDVGPRKVVASGAATPETRVTMLARLVLHHPLVVKRPILERLPEPRLLL